MLTLEVGGEVANFVVLCEFAMKFNCLGVDLLVHCLLRCSGLVGPIVV